MRTKQFISMLTIILFLTSGPAGAQNVVFGDPQNPTKATAINDLEVGGIHYGVVFELQKFANEIYGPFPGTFNIFDTVAEAENAVDAVNLALNGAGALSIGNIDLPETESQIYNIGYESFLLGQIESIHVWRAGKEGDDWLSLAQNQWTYNLDERSWAVFTITTAVDDDDVTYIPKAYKLFPNFPNPFNPTTKITYILPKASTVYLAVYHMLGQQIRTLVNRHQAAGRYTVEWNGLNNSGEIIPSGVYMYTIEAGDFMQSKKMTLLK